MPVLAAKPRLLVCAPSNAAADELLQRVMTSGFTGNDGRVYFPSVVRSPPLHLLLLSSWNHPPTPNLADELLQRVMTSGCRPPPPPIYISPLLIP